MHQTSLKPKHFYTTFTPNYFYTQNCLEYHVMVAKAPWLGTLSTTLPFTTTEQSERTQLPGILLALLHLAESQQEEGYHGKEATRRQWDRHDPETGDASAFENWWKRCIHMMVLKKSCLTKGYKRCPGESDNLLRPQGHHSSLRCWWLVNSQPKKKVSASPVLLCIVSDIKQHVPINLYAATDRRETKIQLVDQASLAPKGPRPGLPAVFRQNIGHFWDQKKKNKAVWKMFWIISLLYWLWFLATYGCLPAKVALFHDWQSW